FRGDTSALIFQAILDRAPTPPIRLNPDLPPRLEEIISKALEKDRNLRYQHASEMRADLQRLKRDTESGRSVAIASVEPVTTRSAGPTTPSSSATAARLILPPTTKRTDYKQWSILIALVAVCVLIGIGILIYRQRPKVLTAKDTIVLADFSNTTGEAVFDGTLKQALSAQLEQSPFLSILSDERIRA